jgi:tetratricopeptide repeat protein
MPTSEIEKLERRYAENPQGLTFAPLAEVHRKNGDIPRALELLRAGLELHPNYIPASIVLGRCHWDLGDLPAAESAFAHVLRLDDENVIALKSLADINERLERFSEAQRWLHRLVSIDRSNEEARQQLTRLETSKEPGAREIVAAKAEPLEAKSPAAVPSPPPAAPAEIAPIELTVDVVEPAPRAQPVKPSVEPAASKKEEPQPSAKLEFLDTSEPALPAEAAASNPPEEPAPLPGLISAEFVPPKDGGYKLHPELTQEFVSGKDSPDRLDVEITEDVELQSSGAAEFRVPNAAEDFMDLAARMNPEPPGLPAAEPAWSAAESTPAPAETTPARAENIPPLDQRETRAKPDSVPPAYSARDTHGQSVLSFFQALLAARPPGNSVTPAAPESPQTDGGAPTGAAQDALSLSSVFGGEGEKVPASPQVPASGQTKDATVSFDDFFGSAAGGSSSLAPGSTEPSKDDLDQFQSWLQNLKR